MTLPIHLAVRNQPAAPESPALVDQLDKALNTVFTPAGDYDPSKVAAFLGIDLSALSKIARIDTFLLQSNPTLPRVQKVLARLTLLLTRIAFITDYDYDRARRWLKSPHAFLDGQTPLSFLRRGKIKRVEFTVGRDQLIHDLNTLPV